MRAPGLDDHEVAATPSGYFPLRLRWSWLGVAALLIQIWAVYFAHTDGAFGFARRVVLPSSFVVLLVFALRNWHLWGLRLIAIGLFLNLLVISLNGGLMPVSPEEVASVDLLERIEGVHLGDPVPGSKGILMAPGEARLWFLSDVIVFPPRSPVARVVSVGDLVIGLGLVITLAEAVARPIAKKNAAPAT